MGASADQPCSTIVLKYLRVQGKNNRTKKSMVASKLSEKLETNPLNLEGFHRKSKQNADIIRITTMHELGHLSKGSIPTQSNFILRVGEIYGRPL